MRKHYKNKYGKIYIVKDNHYILEKHYEDLGELFDSETDLRLVVEDKGFEIKQENICLAVNKRKKSKINFIHKLELEYVLT